MSHTPLADDTDEGHPRRRTLDDLRHFAAEGAAQRAAEYQRMVFLPVV